MPSIARVRTVLGGLVQGGGVSTHYFTVLGPDAVEAQPLIDAIDDFWVTLAPSIASQVTFSVEGQVDILDVETGDLVTSVSGTGTAPGPFGGGASPLPPQTQGLLRWVTGVVIGGRRVYGRTFIPGPMQNLTGDNVIGPNAATRTLWLTAANALIGEFDPEIYALAVWSRKNGQAVPIQSPAVGAKWSYLSSRRD